MKYTFLLYSDPSAMGEPTPEEMEQELAVFGAYIGMLRDAGAFVDTDWLQPTQNAVTVSTKDGEAVVHDGPFSETQEQLGGYFVIEAPDLGVAVEWAKQCPTVHYGKVEVRGSAMPG
ncbi:YciI family protein [Microbacterium aquimaris]|uniref:YciI family protein n=1 Tax=Microbacterium aquimaris TaxID=459816 RepID=A0ABU5N3H0_9MICO|nr:YciI family protein [Microbacterium aquimaris]MDZ8160624.1 YciI family protein [Microbacterium aquimaris]